MTRDLICLALVASAFFLRPAPALAAESYDNCTGFITSLPVTITTQGVWCLDRDLSTAISSGYAITIGANNVTIDCNHFKIGGLQAGKGTIARGMYSYDRLNTTVRNCNIRGFRMGISFTEGGGHLIEGNRFEANTYAGIYVYSDPTTIRDNQVFDTGDATAFEGSAIGIYAGARTDIIDNTVDTIRSTGTNSHAYGIYNDYGYFNSVVNNRVRRIYPTGTGIAYGVYAASSLEIVVRDNTLQVRYGESSVGIRCSSNKGTAHNNVIVGFITGVQNCVSSHNSVNTNN